ncbi:hypothetical protein [Dehalogenimonas sp. 4OHTPN]|uniref:Uncharacterized protein n=1 Tax=Dehalogenimonas sp. 4OHTPN TaxID=3166643 RepID=A0AAU8GAU6_9CHLR
MTEARVFIDLKEGVIELEGPIAFVEKYIAIYAPAAAAESVPETPRKRGRPAKKGALPLKKKKVNADRIIGAMIDNGFFNSARGFGAIKVEALKMAPDLSDTKIRKALQKVKSTLPPSGTGRGTKYLSVQSA